MAREAQGAGVELGSRIVERLQELLLLGGVEGGEGAGDEVGDLARGTEATAAQLVVTCADCRHYVGHGITGTVDGGVRTLVTTWPEKITRPGYWMASVGG